MILAVVVPFRDEERYLGALLQSISSQRRPPDCICLVDDGSRDASPRIAQEFAERHAYARFLVAPPYPCQGDRLAVAAELRAFQWAVDQVDVSYDIVAKLDADLWLPRDHFGELVERFTHDAKLGVAGSHLLEVGKEGRGERLRCPPGHVHGAAKFYRRECLDDISPLPPILGWDTIDEVRARMNGWHTATFALVSGDAVHLRPMGSTRGLLRGFRRAGVAAYGYGSSPVLVLLAATARLRDDPLMLGAMNFLLGWALAVVLRKPRAEPELRWFVRREQIQRLRRFLAEAVRR